MYHNISTNYSALIMKEHNGSETKQRDDKLEQSLIEYNIGPAPKERWYILFIFTSLYALQSAHWFTFSTIPKRVESYYHLTIPDQGNVNPVIDLLLNWGSLVFIPTTPFSAYLLSFPLKGLQYTVRLAITLIFTGSLIRCIPMFLSSFNIEKYQINGGFWNCLIFLHIGQILIAIAGPMVMTPQAKLSAIWFKSNQRTFATGIAASGGVCGVASAFVIGPLLNNVPRLLCLDLSLAFIIFLSIWIYFPAYPDVFPSNASRNALLCHSEKTLNININGNNTQIVPISFSEHIKEFIHEMKELFSDDTAILVITIGGLLSASMSWIPLLQDMLNVNPVYIGIVGLIATLLFAVGAMVAGKTSDRYFHQNYKKIITILLVLLILILGVLFLILPSPFCNGPIVDIDMVNMNGIGIVIVLSIIIGSATFIQGGFVAIFYEFCADVSYPASASSSGTLFMIINQIVTFLLVGVGSWISTKWEITLDLIMCTGCLIVLNSLKEEYKRIQ
eukprot:53848_1